MPDKSRIEVDLENAASSFTEGWLSNSVSLSELVKHRQNFDSAFKTNFLDQLYKLGIGNMFQFSELTGNSNERHSLILKTIPTPFPYYPCVDSNSGNEGSLKLGVRELMEKIHKAQTKSSSPAYLIFTMYPCTKTDKYLKPLIEQVEGAIAGNLSSIEYRFTNNVPGVLYFSKLNYSEEARLKQPEPYFDAASRISNEDITIRSLGKSRRRLRVGLAQDSYFKILEKLHDEMKRNNEEIGFEELQSRFEQKVREKLKLQLPFLSEAEIDERMVAFESKGTGAKKAQILLCTVNEPSRIHYRPEITAESRFNLFVYRDYSGFKIPVRERKLKAFDPSDKSIQDVEIFYSRINKKGEKAEVLRKRVGGA